MRLEQTDVAMLVRDTTERFAGVAMSRGVALDASVEEGIRATIDPARVRQALDNLVDNALRQTPAGGRVTVEASRLEGDLSIVVTDTGAGFPSSFLPQAFQAFTRADSSRSRAAGGAGLGLAIASAVAEAHGGTVDARNGDQGGAIVAIHLPA
jgi:signal transduction histidine kinase